MAQKRETLLNNAIEALINQFPLAKENVLIQEYENSGKMKALKESLKKELIKASKDKRRVVLLSNSGTLWSDLYYLLTELSIDYRYLRITKEVIIDFSDMTLSVVDRENC